MFPETFQLILGIIGPGLHAINNLTNTRIISEEKQLLIAIWFMATPDSYRYISYSVFYNKNIKTCIYQIYVT